MARILARARTAECLRSATTQTTLMSTPPGSSRARAAGAKMCLLPTRIVLSHLTDLARHRDRRAARLGVTAHRVPAGYNQRAAPWGYISGLPSRQCPTSSSLRAQAQVPGEQTGSGCVVATTASRARCPATQRAHSRGSRAIASTSAEYECVDDQARVLLEMRIVANSVSRQTSEPAVGSARSAGGEGCTGGSQRAGGRLGGGASLNGGSGQRGYLGVVARRRLAGRDLTGAGGRGRWWGLCVLLCRGLKLPGGDVRGVRRGAGGGGPVLRGMRRSGGGVPGVW